MELDVRLDKESLAIPIPDPFRLDMDAIELQISRFLAVHGASLGDLDVRGLLPRMVKGIAGCEAGCPADAMSVVRKGHQHFKLEYIEGGILSATMQTADGRLMAIKLFPDF